MAINWNLAGGGFDALEALNVAGQARRQNIAEQQMARQLQRQRQQDAARVAAAGQLGTGNYQGATQTALEAGDFDLAKHIGGLQDDHRKQLAAQGEILGRAAYGLRRVPQAQRAQALQHLAPQLLAAGIQPQELEHADLSDEGLDGYISMSQDIKTQLSGDLTRARIADVATDNARQERLADNTIANAAADNARADRSESRTAHYQALSNARAAQARGEGRVRFNERDKDRAAIAAGGRGIPTTTDDLNY